MYPGPHSWFAASCSRMRTGLEGSVWRSVPGWDGIECGWGAPDGDRADLHLHQGFQEPGRSRRLSSCRAGRGGRGCWHE
jgi:hypothetical protein